MSTKKTQCGWVTLDEVLHNYDLDITLNEVWRDGLHLLGKGKYALINIILIWFKKLF